MSQAWLSLQEAVWAFRSGAALAAGWDDGGMLTPGSRADPGLWEGDRLAGRVWKGEIEWV